MTFVVAEMSVLPDELWRRIFEIGIRCSKLTYRDLCCISISCRSLKTVASDDELWTALLFSDFPAKFQSSLSDFTSSPSFKTLYRDRFVRDRDRKLLAHRRAVLRIESQIAQSAIKIKTIRIRSGQEVKKFNATLAELSNLQDARRSSVALNVWQPEVIRGWQKQIVEQCVVPIESRINALEMELKLCEQQIDGFNRAYKDEKRKLDAAKEQLAYMKYHPLQDQGSKRTGVDQSNITRKKLKKCFN